MAPALASPKLMKKGSAHPDKAQQHPLYRRRVTREQIDAVLEHASQSLAIPV
jgi:hypothetical protein